MDVGSGKRIWHSGGGAGLGKHSGAGETFWNIRAKANIKFPERDFGPNLLNLIAVNPVGQSIKEKDGKWYEVISPQNIFPTNIHEAQLEYRLGRKGVASSTGTVTKSVESNDKSKLLKYRLLD